MMQIEMHYIAPVVAGLLIAGCITKRLNPLSRPSDPLERPNWVLGLWTGVSAAVALYMALKTISHFSAHNLAALGLPTAALFAALAAPGLALSLYYRSKIERALDSGEIWYTDEDQVVFYNTQDIETDEMIDSVSDVSVYETESNLAETDTDVDNGAVDDQEAAHEAIETIATDSQQRDPEQAEQEPASVKEQYDDAFELAFSKTLSSIEKSTQLPVKGLPVIEGETELNFLHQARKLARSEYDLRCRTETNLRITRAALTKLESQSRKEQTTETDIQMETEQLLSAKTREISALESKLMREQELRAKAEEQQLQSKDLVLQAKTEVRKNMEARSKALLTARKTMLLAKKSVAARTRIQNELNIVREQLEQQNVATSSLIEALETEKLVNRNLVEKQDRNPEPPSANRKLRRTDVLKNKLVRKVAKPRKELEKPAQERKE